MLKAGVTHPHNKYMAENNSTQFKTEGQPAFPVANEENGNSAASSAGEKTNADQTGSADQNNQQQQNQNGGEQNKGFADDPRWKEREADWDKRFNEQETRHVGEVQKFREGVDKTISDAVAAALAKAGVSPRSGISGNSRLVRQRGRQSVEVLPDSHRTDRSACSRAGVTEVQRQIRVGAKSDKRRDKLDGVGDRGHRRRQDT